MSVQVQNSYLDEMLYDFLQKKRKKKKKMKCCEVI